jgi:uncharacterized membrane protein YphA (DoxX/SURF4 family)
VGGTFLAAGILKSLDVEGFARDISLHGILGPSPSRVLALFLVPFEIVAGVAALIGYRRRLALHSMLGALAVFVLATGWAWWNGNTEGCGCFGQYAARTPLAVIAQDLLLMAAGVASLLLAPPAGLHAPLSHAGHGQPPERWRPALVGLIAVLATAFALASPHLPLDSLATSLREGASLHDLGLDRIGRGLGEGDHLLAILVLDEDRSRAAIPSLNTLAGSPGFPPLVALVSADETARAEFFWSFAPSFELLEFPAPDLRRLYRRAPRVFRMHNGSVLRVWETVPTPEDLAK